MSMTMMLHGRPISRMEAIVADVMAHVSPTPRTYGEWLASRPRRKLKGWQKRRR